MCQSSCKETVPTTSLRVWEDVTVLQKEVARNAFGTMPPLRGAARAPLRAFAPDGSDGAVQDMVAAATTQPVVGLFLFVSATLDFDLIVATAQRCAPGIPIAACTTAGEITDMGYAENGVVAIGFPSELFDIVPIRVPDIKNIDRNALITRIIRSRAELKTRNPSLQHEFGFLLINGLSMAEDALMQALAPALGSLNVFGGTAGDNQQFLKTRLWYAGRDLDQGAAIFLVRSRCRSKVFRTDNFTASKTRMVVTDADVGKRLVRRINDEPAAQEYARMLGKSPKHLSLDTFAAHPVAVRVGAAHHIRAIQEITEEGHLVFASAIDEGMVFSLAEEEPIVPHLERFLADLATPQSPAMVLGFECLFRRLASSQSQCAADVSAVFRTYGLVGFSTYGEQYNTLHVNQTLVGVAFYPAE